jgi:mono/diheme cytochrome c family protein
MKWVFLLALAMVAGAGALMGAVVVTRWNNNMTQTPKIVTGERVFAMPAGTLPRTGGKLPMDLEKAKKRPNPIKATAESVAHGQKLFTIYCSPCHGAEGRADGPVAAKYVPPPPLQAELVQAKSDGFMEHYMGSGGALMPAYGESLSEEERWHVVNFIRSLAKK